MIIKMKKKLKIKLDETETFVIKFHTELKIEILIIRSLQSMSNQNYNCHSLFITFLIK